MHRSRVNTVAWPLITILFIRVMNLNENESLFCNINCNICRSIKDDIYSDNWTIKNILELKPCWSYRYFLNRLVLLVFLVLLDPPHAPAAFPTHPLYLLLWSICICFPAICWMAWFGPGPVDIPACLNCGTVVPPLCVKAFCFATIELRYAIWSAVVAPVVLNSNVLITLRIEKKEGLFFYVEWKWSLPII